MSKLVRHQIDLVSWPDTSIVAGTYNANVDDVSKSFTFPASGPHTATAYATELARVIAETNHESQGYPISVGSSGSLLWVEVVEKDDVNGPFVIGGLPGVNAAGNFSSMILMNPYVPQSVTFTSAEVAIASIMASTKLVQLARRYT